MTGNDPQLYFGEDGAPRSARFGDIYYSLQDGLAESQAVFLAGCHLPDAWAAGEPFTVLELGFGTGLNIAALMQMWTESRPAGGHLHIFSIEGFLMSSEAAHAALGNWPELSAFTDALLAQWPKARRGLHYMDFRQWGVSVTLALMDVHDALDAWSGPADAIFLDGFSPALNPDMWSEAVFHRIAAKSAPGARLATFTVAGFVRRGLQAAGFSIEKHPGFGRKRERLEAVYVGPATRPTPGPRHKAHMRIAVVGAGIAGASLIYQARLLGIAADLFDSDGAGAGASGNAAALVMPRLDAGDNAISALFADAHAYAAALYRRLAPDAVLAEGVYQCESGPRDSSRFDKIGDQAIHAAGTVTRFVQGEACLVPAAAGLRLSDALVIEPHKVLAGLIGDTAIIREAVTQWAVLPDGRITLRTCGEAERTYDAVVIACGAGVFDFGGLAVQHDLRAVRGQLEAADCSLSLAHGVSWGGYAVPTPSGILFGATHDRDDRRLDSREADRLRNIASLRQCLPDHAGAIMPSTMRSRVSIRVTTRDYMPMAGEVSSGVFALTGLGARGFCLGPLLARAVLCDITAAPSPLPGVAKNLLRPERLAVPQLTYNL